MFLKNDQNALIDVKNVSSLNVSVRTLAPVLRNVLLHLFCGGASDDLCLNSRMVQNTKKINIKVCRLVLKGVKVLLSKAENQNGVVTVGRL